MKLDYSALKRASIGGVSVLTLALVSTTAQAQVTLPSTGIVLGDYVTELVTGIGAIAGVAIGASFAFFILRRGVSWVKGFVR